MLLAPPALTAEAPLPTSQTFDLPGVLSRARTENAMIRAARARVDERRGLITSVRADALPQLTMVNDFSRVRDVSILNSGIGDSVAKFGFTPDSLVSPRNAYTSRLDLSQPLYYWGKIGTAIDIARMGEQEAEAGFTTAELEILHGVAKAYLGVLMARADLDVVEARRRTAERFLADVKAKLEAQSATELDRLRAESELLTVLPEALQAEAALKRATEVLDGLLGLDPRTPLQLAELAPADTGAALQPVERSEIAQYKVQERMLRANDRIITSDLRPKFDFTTSYGYQAGKTENLWKQPYDAWRVSITMKWPIFDGLRSAGKRAQNNAQLEQVRQARLDKDRAVAVERRSAERELEKAVAFLEAARKAHDAGLEALRMSRESFDQGLITSLDLLQAERTERQLESQRLRASLGVWSALFDHRRALGLPPL